MIPAGFYTVQMLGPGGCTNLPYFNLKGPGNNIIDSMDQGEEAAKNVNANFLPNSTYTWWDGANPSAVYTFATNGEVVGTPPPTPVSPKHGTASTSDLIGSARATIRGTVTGAVSAAGKLSFAFKGKSVGSLQSGKYNFVVTRQQLDERIHAAEGLARPHHGERGEVRRQALEVGRPQRRQVVVRAAGRQDGLYRRRHVGPSRRWR